ncbi:HEAT repeat domain-containing protein [Enhygromyxa salina]|uniref:HEAT repeat domain-containing protein n=1 Tax=Enhygromyxa salina TaxID=215803 RepID=UPI0011B28059|nr:HEAT repeat domain-containing protein [Enhygromyxa salina]
MLAALAPRESEPAWVDAILPYFSSPDPDMRMTLCYAMPFVGGVDSSGWAEFDPPLISMCRHDPDPAIRDAAATLLPPR